MTRATAGFLSVLCLTSGALMVSYSLTADIEGSLDTTSVIAVPSGAFSARPLMIRDRRPAPTGIRRALWVTSAYRRR